MVDGGRERAIVPGVAALAALALALRVAGADSGLWVDELISVPTLRSPLAVLVTSYPGDFHHPLYSVLAHAAWVLFGDAPWVFRLPALIAGTAAVPLLFVFARRMASPAVALFASALLATSYHHIWFSQNARGYILVCLLVLAATSLLQRALTRGEAASAGAYAACVALGAYTHLTMVLVSVSHFLVALAWQAGLVEPRPAVHGRGGWSRLVLLFGGAAGGTLLLYQPMLPQVLAWFLGTESAVEDLSTARWALVEAVRRLGLGVGGTVTVAVVGVVCVAGLWRGWQRDRLSALLMVAPGAAVLVGPVVTRGTLYPRYFVFLLPFAYLVLVLGLAAIGSRVLSPRAAAWAAAVVLVVHLAPLPRLYRHPKQDFEGAMSFVEAERRAHEAVVAAGPGAEFFAEHYGRPWPKIRSVAELEARAAEGPVWVLYTLPRFLAFESPALMARLEECERRRRLPGTLGGGDFFVRWCPALTGGR